LLLLLELLLALLELAEELLLLLELELAVLELLVVEGQLGLLVVVLLLLVEHAEQN
jgi:hypothetical protein